MPSTAADAAEQVILVTGMSGAGRSTALKVLEDIGYEAVDNLPLSLLPALVAGGRGRGRPLAIGVDIRTRDFGVDPFLEELDRLMNDPRFAVRTLFLDCDDEVLMRRFTETRRRHPLAADRPLPDTIRLERRLLARLRDRADLVIDSTNKSQWELKAALSERFRLERDQGLSLFVTSFSFRHGLPREADLVFDVRFLTNPHYDPVLRPLTGQDAPVDAAVAADPDFPAFFERLTGMLQVLLPRYRREGKSYLTIAIGCTGGRHRSVAVTERLTRWLADAGWDVHPHHRDIHRSAGRDMA